MRKQGNIKLKSTTFLKILLLILLGLVVGACNNKEFDIGDGGFLSKEACSPPCFMHIVSGSTNKTDTIEILKDNRYWDNCVIGKTIVCYENLVISISNDHDMVEGIGFRPTTKIKLEQAIKEYGEPDKVVVYVNEYPDWVQISLFFEKIRTRLDLSPQDGKIYVAEPSSEITLIAYLDISSFESSVIQGRAQKWIGYGRYEYNNP